MTKNNNSEDLLHNQIATLHYLERQRRELKKENKDLKERNHKLKQQYDLLQVRHCSLNNSYQRILNALNETIERNSKAIEYIENEMPYLWEVDDVWEDIEGNYQHNYKEYDYQILLNKLKGVDKSDTIN